MKGIAIRGRKILSNIFRAISVSAASLILQACYGVLVPDEPYAMYGMPPETLISGKVVAKETGKPISGIEVSIERTNYWDRTDKYGYFDLRVPIQDVYKLKFEDVDGPYNDGLFQKQTRTLTRDDTYTNLSIGMDLDTQNNEE